MEGEFSTKAKPVKEKMVAQGEHISEFIDAMQFRLEVGRKKYDDKSFLTDNLFTDIKEELYDIANYAYLLYERIRRLELGEKASDYLNFCNVVDLTTDSDRDVLAVIFKEYKVCHRLDGREFHYCEKGDVEFE